MILKIPKVDENLAMAMRKAGYSPDQRNDGNQSFSRRLMGAPYPKFHIYVDDAGNEWVFKLHLDQNKPKYEGTAAHGGEYEGELVEQEAERIKQVLVDRF
jgi:hypothetical protein